MSHAPRNPFESAPDQFGQPAQKSSHTWLWVLGIIGGVFLLGGMLCCGLMFYAWNQTSALVATEAVKEFADDPTFVEKIGTVQSAEMNLGEAMTESTKEDAVSAMVFDISGDKGSGKIVLRTNDQTGQTTAKLILSNGQEYDLEMTNEFEDLDAELEGLEDMEAEDDLPTIELPSEVLQIDDSESL